MGSRGGACSPCCWKRLAAREIQKWSRLGVVLASAVYLGLWEMLGQGNFFPEAFNPVFNGIGYALLALIGMFVIAYARLLPAAIPTRILRSRLLTKLGVISYGLYVYSWIVMVLIRLTSHLFPGGKLVSST